MFVLHYQPLGQTIILQFINTQCTINTLLSDIVIYYEFSLLHIFSLVLQP